MFRFLKPPVMVGVFAETGCLGQGGDRGSLLDLVHSFDQAKREGPDKLEELWDAVMRQLVKERWEPNRFKVDRTGGDPDWNKRYKKGR